ncbi:MAG: hypothetical protein DWQ37_08355 [Planctomycetota bacterium]|nr:MAG: hypothetical protein DWQ37_08355 [Planctomycetota bacterium]
METNPATTDPAGLPDDAVSSGPPRAAVRWIVSVLVALHVAAVFVGPWAMPPSNSELSATVGQTMQPYLDVLALGNGYRFFAPEPGPSHLIRYEITRDDGSLVEGEFPNRGDQWPRLLYHRYFMLTEFVNTLSGSPDDKQAQAYAQAYARHLADEHDAKTVKLFLRRHYVPRSEEVRKGVRLTDKILYEERPLVTYERD